MLKEDEDVEEFKGGEFDAVPTEGKYTSEVSIRHQINLLYKSKKGLRTIFKSLLLPTVAPCAVVVTTAQLHSTKPELRFCAGSNSAYSASEIRVGEDGENRGTGWK